MFIFLAYVSLALIELYRRYQRRLQYSAAMLRALRSGSVLVQRGKNAQHGSVGALLNSSLLSCSRSYKETLVLSDDHLDVSTVSPKQTVDLGEWSSYLDLHPAQANSNSVVALLEAGPADSRETARGQNLATSVHVLKHGCPLAWKSGNPFGIILHCSFDDFVTMCDAFGQGQLTLNEDLQLYRMLTVSTVGKPKSLRRPRSEEIASTADREHLKTRRANTDPVRLLASMDGHPPTSASLRSKCDGDLVKTNHADSNSTAKPKVGLGHRGEQGDSLYAEGSAAKKVGSELVSELKSSKATLSQTSVHTAHSDESSEMKGSRSTGMVQGHSLVLEQSPVIQMSFDFAGKDAQSLSSSDTPVTLDSLSTEGSDKTTSMDFTEKVVSQNAVPLSSTSGDASGKNVPVSTLNGCEESSDVFVKDFSKSMTTSPHEFTMEESNSQRKDDVKSSVNANTMSALQKDSNTSSTVSGSEEQGAEADAESCTSLGDSQQDSDKPAHTTPAVVSVNGSEHSGSNGAVVSSPPKSVSKVGDLAVNGHDSSQSKKVEGEKSLSSDSLNSSNATHDSDDKNGGQMMCKPPNVVVYCGKKDSARKFEIIKEGLAQCLNPSAYTVYILPHEEVMTLPWEDNSAVLIISHDYLHDNIGKKFTNFLLNGGKVLSFGSSLEAEFIVRKEGKGRRAITKFDLQKWRDVSSIQGHYHYMPGSLKKGNSSMETLVADPSNSLPLVVRLMLSPEHANGTAIFSQLFLERDPSEMASDSKTFSRLKQSSKQRWEVLRYLLSLLDLDTSITPSLSLTPCYLLVQDQALRKSFLDSIAGRMKQDTIRSRLLTLKFVTSKSGSSALSVSADTLPVVTDIPAGSFKAVRDSRDVQLFDPEAYWRHLTTSVLGQVVMYTEVIPTTMTVFEGIQFSLPEDVGVVAIAGHQIGGKGRGGNQWLSPAGCAMFTLPLRMPLESRLGQRVSFVQHIVSLSVVHSICTMPGYEDLDLRLKWPNDIYYGNKTKLGGVLVNSTTMGKTMHATVGCGVNVSNSLPTVCINSIIQDHNRAAPGSDLKLLTTSEVLARTVSMMEKIVAQFQDKGHEEFCQLYYKYWLHSGTWVKVESEGNADVEIAGLDDYGFLRVVNKQGQQFSVHPDGNSFDMLRNLVYVKRD